MTCLFCLLLLAMCKDIISYKIDNQLILIGILSGLFINFYEVGWTGLIVWLCGVTAPIIFLFPLFLFKVLGAGDIKLFSVIGGFYGVAYVFKSVLVAFMVAAIMSVIYLVKYKQVFYRLHHLVNYIQTVRYQKDNELCQKSCKMKVVPYYDMKRDGYNGVIHFSVAIFAAMMLQVIFHI